MPQSSAPTVAGTRLLSRLLLAALPVAVACAVAMPPEAAALDCAKARTPHDAAVCKHRDLSELAAQTEGLWFAYSRVPFLMGANGARHDEEAAFQHKRASCHRDLGCLRRVYRARIDALKIDLAQAMDNIRREENEAQPAFPAALPAPTEAVIAGYADQCRALGGALTGPSRPDMLAGDFDGDGTPDYLLNPHNPTCSAAATAFCGNGGCQITIALSGTGFKDPIMVLGGQPTVSQTADGTRVEVWVDRTNCTLANPDQTCWAAFSWQHGKLDKRYQARPPAN